MNNSEKYKFSDFTLKHYKKIIKTLKEKHTFMSFTNFEKQKNFVLKRHDVDFTLENALDLAIIESELGVTSTYFLMLHCEFYNLLEKKNIEIVKKISNMGHEIGLHFDAQFYDISDDEDLNDKISLEKRVLENFLEIKIEVFSFHNTTPFTMSCQNYSYGNLINTYSSYFQENLGYCSDSNGYWRFNRMIDFIKENNNKSLQILTHPVWWTKEIDSPKLKIEKLINHTGAIKKKFYEDTLSSFGRENIDWN
jgi:hypothetical protein